MADVKRCKYCGKETEYGDDVCTPCYRTVVQLPPFTREQMYEHAQPILRADASCDLDWAMCYFAQFVLDQCVPGHKFDVFKMYDHNEITGEDYYETKWGRRNG